MRQTLKNSSPGSIGAVSDAQAPVIALKAGNAFRVVCATNAVLPPTLNASSRIHSNAERCPGASDSTIGTQLVLGWLCHQSNVRIHQKRVSSVHSNAERGSVQLSR